MNNLMLFWFLTIFLSALSLIFILPWITSKKLKKILVFAIFVFSYTGYLKTGFSSLLPAYYAENEIKKRQLQVRTRVLLSELRKKEFKLQVKLEENPQDIEARWNLFNIKGIHAFQLEEYNLALEYWQKALELMPKTEETKTVRAMIERLIVKVRNAAQ